MNNKANIKFEGVDLFQAMGNIVEAHVRAYKEEFFGKQRKGRPGRFYGCVGLWERGCWTSATHS